MCIFWFEQRFCQNFGYCNFEMSFIQNYGTARKGCSNKNYIYKTKKFAADHRVFSCKN